MPSLSRLSSSRSVATVATVAGPSHNQAQTPSSPIRANEHLAVLLPRDLWKADYLADRCENLFCRVKFSLFERRHHCRKCGGIYCASCTTRSTALLDASKLDFIHPPRQTSIYTFESPTSPIHISRTCDECWEQIHGTISPRTPDLDRSATPISVTTDCSSNSEPCSLASSLATPPDASLVLLKALRNVASTSSLDSASRLQFHIPNQPIPENGIMGEERSYGELDAYPLKRSSALCKVTGGGRWQPKPSTVPSGYRTPVIGGKAPFELQMELEEAAERIRRSNPIVRDGDFQYRVSRAPEPDCILSSSFQQSTF